MIHARTDSSQEDRQTADGQDRKAIATQAFGAIDILLLPTTTTTVPLVENAKGNPQALSPRNTLFPNYYGLPAISVPCGFDSKGLPIGRQLVSPAWDEDTVLQLAAQYENATDSWRKRPIA